MDYRLAIDALVFRAKRAGRSRPGVGSVSAET
jgi:hypothetical protein